MIPADPAMLERNLRALQRHCGELVAQIASSPSAPVDFSVAPDGGLTGTIRGVGGSRRLASAKRPLDEAKRLADRFDPAAAGIAVVMGFGLGHHVRELAERLGTAGATVVFEPDVSLLRAVLERHDMSQAFAKANVVIVTEPDSSAITELVSGAEVAVSLGVTVLDHVPSLPRLGVFAERAREALTIAVRAIRANVVTTLMQTETSIRNGLMNLDHYASAPGIGELTQAAAGRPAIVVSAGPSLTRNIRELARPGVRDRFVIVAVQTVLRQLLAAGIRPHFVTALDHHEISARFYEGLTARDVEGVTLVVEPKANPAILDSFPGAIRCVHDSVLSSVLGTGFAHDGCEMSPGATVAHMAYSFARHVGCDPVVLVGQDLGFTDGQYYGAGAAIHDVWAGELNGFNTLEMMEWQRVVRNRGNLRVATDQLGRPVYTDEQMSAYQVQFERMFASDAEAGRTTVDATEGGVAKRATVIRTLAEVVDAELGSGPSTLGLPEPEVTGALRGQVGVRVADRLDELREEVDRVTSISHEALALLGEMRDAHDDCERVNGLIERVQSLSEEVRSIKPAYELVQHLNQTGQFKRFRADRLLHLDPDLSPEARQLRQIERDIVNIEWIAEASEQLGRLLATTEGAMRGRWQKLTRDPVEHGLDAEETLVEVPAQKRVAAMIAVDPDIGALGVGRDLARPLAGGRNALQLTLDRLGRCEELGRAVLLTEHPERVRAMLGDAPRGGSLAVEIEQTERHPLGARRHGVAAARAFASDCWRGGLCAMTVWDEAFDPETTSDAMARLGIDGAVVVGADWALVDVDLTDSLIERYQEDPPRRTACFAQAAPGLSACVLDRSAVDELARNASRAGGFASVGGLLGYVPRSAVLDPVAKPGCVRVGPELRDVGGRLVADSPFGQAFLGRVLEGADTMGSAAGLGGSIRMAQVGLAKTGPAHCTLELCTGRRTGGVLAQLRAGTGGERAAIGVEGARRIVDALVEARPDATLTLAGVGDPMMHPGVGAIIGHARDAGLRALHVRTDLQCDRDTALGLLDLGATVVSVDLLAETPETYRMLAGPVTLGHAVDNLVAMLETRASRIGGVVPGCWIVPRITRCDAVYQELEPFFDRWLTVAQACVIDPLPEALDGQRIAPLPEPVGRRRARALSELDIRSDGQALGRPGRWRSRGLCNVLDEGLVKAWTRVLRARLDQEDLREAIVGTGTETGSERASDTQADAQTETGASAA